MTRGCSRSVARVGRSEQPGLNRQLRRWLARELHQLRPLIAKSALQTKANRYRKHFGAFSHACLLIFHAVSGGESLRQSYAAFASCPGLVALSGLALSNDTQDDDQVAVSYSQFAASNTTRPARFLAGIIPSLVTRVRQAGKLADAGLPPELLLIDSTFLRLSLLLSPWLPNSGPSDIPGVRLHLQYTPALDLPEQVLVSDTRTTDRGGFDRTILDDPKRLERLAHRTLVFDLGYYGHLRFARLRAALVHFVTRLHPQATVQVEAELPVQKPLPGVQEQRIKVLHDQRVTLGSPTNPAGAVLPGLRLVTAEVAPLVKAARRGAKSIIYRVLTDRWDLGAADLVQIYLWRWQIELFLRWLKSHVHLPRLLGYSRNAVEMTVWLAIVVHLLTVLAAWALGRTRRCPTLLRQLPWALAHLTAAEEVSPVSSALQLHLLDCPPIRPAPT